MSAFELVCDRLTAATGTTPRGNDRQRNSRCPAHEDTNPSLSIRAIEGSVLMHCFAGCDVDDVLAALDLTRADLYDERKAVYRYDDGRAVYRTYHRNAKRFYQSGATGAPTLYHLQRLVNATDGGVFLVEGEKDVHAIESAGGIATTAPMGAGNFDKVDVTPLKGRYVTAVVDRDDAGRTWAAIVARVLGGTVAGLRFVQARTGKDSADHVAAGHGLDDFDPVEYPVLEQDEVPDAKKEERSKPPVADPAIYAGVLGEIVHAADATTEADPVGVYVSLLAGVGALIGPGPHVQVGNTRHPLLISPLLFGRTGSGRKGEATDTARFFLLSSHPDYAALEVGGLSSGEGLIERIRDPDPDNEKDTGGTTDKRLIVVEPEFASVMARARREGSTLATVLRMAWDGRPLSVLNRRALKASGSHVAIIGHITPKEFRLRLAEADMTGGTFNRFLPIYVERSKRLPIPDGVDQDTVTTLSAKLRRAMSAAVNVHRLQLDRAATDLWTGELYDEFTVVDDEEALWGEFTRRAAPYSLRVAGLLAALDGRRLIGKDDLAAAGALVRYSIASAQYVLDRQRRDPRIERITRALDGAGKAGLSRTEISGLFSRQVSAEVLDALLAEITADGAYVRYERRTGGRPAIHYCAAGA